MTTVLLFAVLVTSLAVVALLLRADRILVDKLLPAVRALPADDSGEISEVIELQGRRFDRELQDLHQRMTNLDMQLGQMNAVLSGLVEMVARRSDGEFVELAGGASPGEDSAPQGDHGGGGGGDAGDLLTLHPGQPSREGSWARQRDLEPESSDQNREGSAPG